MIVGDSARASALKHDAFRCITAQWVSVSTRTRISVGVRGSVCVVSMPVFVSALRLASGLVLVIVLSRLVTTSAPTA